MKTILIVGANFNNKGAQSMLFVTVDEIKKRFPNAKIYFGGIEKWKQGIYSFDQVYYRDYNKALAMKSLKGINRCAITFAKDIVKTIMGKSDGLVHILDLKKVISSIDLMIDISGFNLGKQWNTSIQEDYLDNIRLAKSYHIPIIMMPQSFGPFDYGNRRHFLFTQEAELLQYPIIIFAREEESKQQLEESFGLTNVRLSTDLVLQNREINRGNIFHSIPDISVPHISGGSIGIVPNMKCVSNGNETKIMQLYQEIIRYLADQGKKTYIFRHSKVDDALCTGIYSANKKNGLVEYIDRDFDCFEYSSFVKQFEFIICSRYHGIVNAYRNGVPAIILGWAQKYSELAQVVYQEKNEFDIAERVETESILAAVKNMLDHHEEERRIIQNRVITIQKQNCFTVLEEIL